MAIAKIVLNGETQIDVTQDTVLANKLLTGYTAHKADGTIITGTASGGGGAASLQTKSKTYTPTNSQQTDIITPDEDYDGLSQVSVTVNAMPAGIAGTPTASKGTVSNHSVSVTPSVTNTSGYIAGGTKTGTAVTVNANELVSGTLNINSNDTYDVTNYASVNVNVSGQAISLQSKSATPTESAQSITPDAGYNGLSQVDIAAISSTYVGTGITRRSSTDLTASGSTVTVPVGYYSTAATKSISGGSAFTPAVTITANPTISINNSTGVITATYGGSSSITPTVTAGYISTGTAGTVSTAGTNTLSMTTQAAKTVTPTESEQNAVAANVYTTGIVKVGAISSNYVGSNIPTRSAANLTVSGSTVTAAAGYYSSATSKSVSSGSVTAPTTITSNSATVTTGTNTLTLSKSVSVTPNVTTAGYISSGTAGNATVTLTANVTTKAASTITPGTTNQTIASGTYLTGTQTIAGDADLVAGNIRSGANIFGVAGTYSGLDTSDATATAIDIVDGETAYVDGRKIEGTLVVNDYYTGSTAPSASLGKNGDIYFQS